MNVGEESKRTMETELAFLEENLGNLKALADKLAISLEPILVPFEDTKGGDPQEVPSSPKAPLVTRAQQLNDQMRWVQGRLQDLLDRVALEG